MRTFAYGVGMDQVADLYLPDSVSPPVLCLIHGGFWRARYGRDHIAPLAEALAVRGFAVWSIEYRRVGQPGGGWPGTLEDAGCAIDHLGTLVSEQGIDLDLARVASVGHSAGGQLALWCLQRSRAFDSGLASRRIRLRAAVGLAPVADLRLAQQLRCGRGAVDDFLGGTPGHQPERYRRASPAELLPLGAPQLLMHGDCDEDVPITISRRYAAAAAAAGDEVQLIELPGTGHMELIDPRGAAFAAYAAWLEAKLSTHEWRD